MLFLKECKKVIWSLIYVVYLVAVIVIFNTQFGCELNEKIEKPKATDNYYGLIQTNDENVIMSGAIYSLMDEYEMNCFVSYPFGIYKEVKLTQAEKAKMDQIISNLIEEDKMTIKSTLTYDEFLNYMKQADELLGGNSKYNQSGISSEFANIPMSYEEALAEYESITTKGELGKTYIRLFCDYLGIILGIMPIFVCASMWQSDKKHRVEALVYSRKISSFKLVGIRYAALLAGMFLPVAGTYIYTMFKLNGLYAQVDIEILETFGLMILWLLPQIMIILSLGTFISILWSVLGAVFVQIVWWFMNVIVKMKLTGGITKWDLVVRHNKLGEVQLFNAQWDTFVWNRMFYFILAVVLFVASVIVYNYKRKGKLNGKRMLHKHNKSKFEA